MSMIQRLALDFDEADRIRKAMRASGVGVSDLATRLDVNRNTVGNWINGHVQPSVQSMYAIAAITGVPFQWLKTGMAPSDEDEANSGESVRPKGFEPPTF